MAKPQQDLAPNETRRIDGLQLAALFREPMYPLGSKRGYMQTLDLIWTRGKNHPLWDGEVDARQLADAAREQVKEDPADTRWDFLLPLTLIQACSEGP